MLRAKSPTLRTQSGRDDKFATLAKSKHPIAKLTPDTRFVEDGPEWVEDEPQWPRRYTTAELEAIANAAGVRDPVALEELQQAADAYQWARSADPGGEFFLSNEQRRSRLINILKLLRAQASAAEIEKAVNELDAITFQFLGQARADNPRRLKLAAKRALRFRPRGRKRARLQFIGDLAPIYANAIPPIYEERTAPQSPRTRH